MFCRSVRKFVLRMEQVIIQTRSYRPTGHAGASEAPSAWASNWMVSCRQHMTICFPLCPPPVSVVARSAKSQVSQRASIGRPSAPASGSTVLTGRALLLLDFAATMTSIRPKDSGNDTSACARARPLGERPRSPGCPVFSAWRSRMNLLAFGESGVQMSVWSVMRNVDFVAGQFSGENGGAREKVQPHVQYCGWPFS